MSYYTISYHMIIYYPPLQPRKRGVSAFTNVALVRSTSMYALLHVDLALRRDAGL